jgi:hypothetical protein
MEGSLPRLMESDEPPLAPSIGQEQGRVGETVAIEVNNAGERHDPIQLSREVTWVIVSETRETEAGEVLAHRLLKCGRKCDSPSVPIADHLHWG